jgi:hypothetical protein
MWERWPAKSGCKYPLFLGGLYQIQYSTAANIAGVSANRYFSSYDAKCIFIYDLGFLALVGNTVSNFDLDRRRDPVGSYKYFVSEARKRNSLRKFFTDRSFTFLIIYYRSCRKSARHLGILPVFLWSAIWYSLQY